MTIRDPIVKCLKQRCFQNEPLHELFQHGELLEIASSNWLEKDMYNTELRPLQADSTQLSFRFFRDEAMVLQMI
jgi:hypothetical protein